MEQYYPVKAQFIIYVLKERKRDGGERPRERENETTKISKKSRSETNDQNN